MRHSLLTSSVLIFFLLFAAPTLADAAADAKLRDAAMSLDHQSVRAALVQGADPNAPSDTKRPLTPLGYLLVMLDYRNERSVEKAVQIAETLFSKGAKLGPYDRAILFFPISSGNERLVALLLEKGASPNRRIEGYTPTELAIKYGHKRVYDLLLSHSGIPVKSSQAAQLALVEAAARGNIEQMEIAVVAGASVNNRDADGRTPLINAVRTPVYDRRRAEAIWWLLDNGADPNGTGNSGFRELEGIPLHIFVAMSKNPLEGVARHPNAKALAEKILIRLLEAGAKVSGMDSKLRTPLHFAARADNMLAAEILIREGARVMARDKEGRTPLDYAESAGMIRLLKAKGATER